MPLTSEQERAVRQPGCMVYLAGPGTGKSQVLIERVAYQIAQGCDPSRILAVTFTAKAAAAMRYRLAEELGNEIGNGVTLQTFHAFGHHILKDHLSGCGTDSRATILDGEQQDRLLQREIEALTMRRADEEYTVVQ